MAETLLNLLDGLRTDSIAPDRTPFLDGDVELDFGDLRERTARTRGLFGRLGLTPGDRVAIASGRTDAVAVLYAASLTAGLTAVVIDPEASAAETNVLLAKARVAATFIDGEIVDRASALQRDEATVVEIADRSSQRTGFGLIRRKRGAAEPTSTFPGMLDDERPLEPATGIDDDSPALILFTSGTTSQPKGVVLTRGNLAAQLVTFRRHYGLDTKTKLVNHLPVHHSDGLNQGLFLAFGIGFTVLRQESVDLRSLGDLCDLVYRERATHLVTVPTVLAMMQRLPDEYTDSFSGPSFAVVISTAGHLDERIWVGVEERFGVRIVNSYGLTETVMEACYCGPDDSTRRVGTIGKPVDCEIAIVDDDGRPVADGDVGELWLRGDNVMAGYFEAPEATAEVLVDGWLRTGDLVRSDADGFLHVAGRKKNVIIRAGTNVYPEDVNAVLTAHDGVSEAATIGMPDSYLGESVVSFVVAGSGGAPSVDALFAHSRERLASEKIPNRIMFVESLPHGPSGKVELAKLVQVANDAEGVGVGDVGSLREQVLALASTVFRYPLEDLSDHSTADTVDGWDSLTFLEFIVGLERGFDVSIDPREVMNLRSLADAVDVVERRRT